ncbi:MAG: hypothetical protein ICV60_10765 [Pyrinomonadaceae bacterium]|nr:hypothetical protein [Pyrinomonadaceae bacterium]
MPLRETKRALIVVRTYPIPALSGVEVSCTAAITDKGEWLRLYPVPYRFLKPDKRFKKYQWIDVSVIKASDSRPESYTPEINTINVLTDPLPTDNEWQARKQRVYPLRVPSLCHLQRERDANKYPTLGFFRPKVIERLRITKATPQWTQAQLDMLRQGHLFEVQPQAELEKVPFDFHYIFRCEDEACKGHALHCTDWEMGQAWRSWSKQYGADWEAPFRQRFETEMIERNDTHFYVGTIQRHPNRWIIIGLFYPPKPKTPLLFEK